MGVYWIEYDPDVLLVSKGMVSSSSTLVEVQSMSALIVGIQRKLRTFSRKSLLLNVSPPYISSDTYTYPSSSRSSSWVGFRQHPRPSLPRQYVPSLDFAILELTDLQNSWRTHRSLRIWIISFDALTKPPSCASGTLMDHNTSSLDLPETTTRLMEFGSDS